MTETLPKIATKTPFAIETKAGQKYSWCACGLSQTQPFCDGSHKAHKNPDGTSVMKSVAFVATENKTIYFCGCKHSKNGMFCDGSHSSL